MSIAVVGLLVATHVIVYVLATVSTFMQTSTNVLCQYNYCFQRRLQQLERHLHLHILSFVKEWTSGCEGVT